MKKRFGRNSMLMLPMMMIALCSQASAASYATLTISSTGTPVSGTGSITVAFGDSAGHLYSETVPYGQYSTPASLAAWLGAKFSSRYLCPAVGNCLSGLGARATGSAVTLQLNNGASFGSLTITNPSASFSFNLSAFTLSTPTISWPAPSAISAGTALSGAQLNATANVAGTFTYFPGPGTVLDAGTQTLSVTFAPTNFAEYTAAAASVSLTVSADQSGQNTPVISWSTPSAITYGTPLSSTQLNASASYGGTSVPGTFEYTPAAGEVLDAGTQTLVAAFFPTDSVHYGTAGGSVDLTISPNMSQGPETIYSYSIANTSGGSGYSSNSNILNYTDSVTGTWSYSYDTLNRLVTGVPATGTYAGNNLCWGYDAFGNRTVQAQQSSACPANTAAVSTLVYSASNQVSGVIAPGGTSPSPSPLGYDAAGNVNFDAGSGNTYLYDGEGRICAVSSSSALGSPIMTAYVYDAEGNRVAKGYLSSWPTNGLCPNLSPSGVFTPTNSYVLGPSGEELSQTDGYGNWTRSNVYAAGMLVATYDIAPTGDPALHFQLTDWLGTRRAQTDIAGNPEEYFASLPFGDGYAVTPASGAPSTADDSTKIHFTSQEHDSESGNDYFGARYYASSMGRWMSSDPSGQYFANPENPQTWNLYAYVANNALINVDPLGLWVWNIGNCYFDTVASYVTTGGDTDFQGYDTQSLGCINQPPPQQPPPQQPQQPQQPSQPQIDCSKPPPMPPTPSGASIDANEQATKNHGFPWWFDQVRPGGNWDYKKGGQQQYAAFGNVNYGATCAAGLGDSLTFCQRGAGAAAYGTAAFSVITQRNLNKWSAGPGNPIGSPGNDNGMSDYGDQATGTENQAVIAGFGYAQWQKACQK